MPHEVSHVALGVQGKKALLVMTVLMNAKFDPETIMPIYLPPNKMFRDTNRNAVAVGMGITAERYSWSL